MEINQTEFSACDRYVSSMTLCNALGLLAFQSNAVDFVKRLAVLVRLKTCWASGHSDVRVVCSTDHSDDTAALNAAMAHLPIVDLCGMGAAKRSSVIAETGDTRVPLPKTSAVSSFVTDVNTDHVVDNISLSKTKRRRKKPVAVLTPSPVRFKTDRLLREVDATPTSVESSKEYADSTHSYTACSICNRRFSSKFRLRNHLMRAHGIGGSTKERDSSGEIGVRVRPPCTGVDAAAANKSDDQLGFVCTVCGRQFRLRQLLASHSVTHTGERPYECRHPGCDKRFGQPSTRNSHERTHLDARPFVCSECGLGFKLQSILRNHIKSIHDAAGGSLSLHQCHVCGKAFKLSGALRTHVRTTHVSERLYACPDCPKRFKSRPQMKRHRANLHSTERPLNCPCCDRTFAQMGNLRIHMRTHTGERPYVCSICGLRFAHSGTLKGHLAGHRKDNDQRLQPLGGAVDGMVTSLGTS